MHARAKLQRFESNGAVAMPALGSFMALAPKVELAGFVQSTWNSKRLSWSWVNSAGNRSVSSASTK
jgi:hypothetical protein